MKKYLILFLLLYTKCVGQYGLSYRILVTNADKANWSSKSRIFVDYAGVNLSNPSLYSTFDYIFDTVNGKIYQYEYNPPPQDPEEELVEIGTFATNAYASNPANVNQTSEHRFVSDIEKEKWSSKSKIFVDYGGVNLLNPSLYSNFDYIFDSVNGKIYQYQYNLPPQDPEHELLEIGTFTTASQLATKQDVLNGNGLVKSNSGVISYDNSTYMTPDEVESTYADKFSLLNKIKIIASPPVSGLLGQLDDVRISTSGGFYRYNSSDEWENSFNAYSASNPSGYISSSSVAATYAPLASPTFTGTPLIPSPFSLGGTSMTTTAARLNYLNSAGGTTGTASTNLVFSTSPTLVAPNLGTPSVVTLTNATGLPISTGVSGLGSGVATFLTTPSSSNLAAALTTKTGTGNAVFSADGTHTGTTNIATIVNTLGANFATSSGSVGIATTSPQTLLEVSAPVTNNGIRVSRNGTASQYLQLDIGTGSSSRLFATGNGKSLSIINNSSAAASGTATDGIQFNVPSSTANSTVTAMTLTSGDSPRMGLGTSTPISKADINGDLRVVNGGKFTGQAGSWYTLGGQVLVDYASNQGRIQSYDGATAQNKDLLLQWNGGNVGIGDVNPTKRLTVASPSGDFGQYIYGNGTGGNNNGLLIDAGLNSSDYSFRVRSGTSSEYFAVRGDGRIGIGTISPSSILHTQTTGTGDKIGLIVGRNSASTGDKLSLVYNSADLGDLASTQAIATSATSADLALTTRVSGSLSEKMRVLGNGNVGIGVTAPNRKLVVNGEIGLAYTDGMAYNGIKLSSDNLGLEFWNGITGSATNNAYRFADNTGAYKVVIQNGGNLGIGTTSPEQKLHVEGLMKLKSYTTTEINAMTGMTVGTITINSTIGLPIFYNGSGWKRFDGSNM